MTFVILFGSRGDGALLCRRLSTRRVRCRGKAALFGAGVEGGMAGVDMAMRDDWLQLVSSERKLA